MSFELISVFGNHMHNASFNNYEDAKNRMIKEMIDFGFVPVQFIGDGDEKKQNDQYCYCKNYGFSKKGKNDDLYDWLIVQT